MRKARAARTKEQQKAYREEQKRLRRPSRDDIARSALRWLIVTAYQRGPRFIDALETSLLLEVSKLGFDSEQSERAIEDLVEKYTRGQWDFQRKPHLASRTPPITS